MTLGSTDFLTLERWRKSGADFSYNGHTVRYYRAGQPDRVIMLIHGFPTASWDWHLLWQDLAGDYAVISVDMIGFGYSAKPRNYAYSLVDQANLIESLLDYLAVDECHILAHDYGDSVAQELLSRQGGQARFRLLSLCFLNGGLFPETHRALLIQKLLHTPLGALLSVLLNRRSFDRSFSAVFGQNSKPTTTELEEFWSLIEYNKGRRLFHKLIRYMGERKLHRDRWLKSMQTTQIPMRVIDGAADPVSGEHMVARYRELIPSPDTVLLTGVGHYPQCEAPDLVLQHYLAFLEKI